MHAGILVHEGVKTPAELAEINPRVLSRLLNLETEDAERIVAAARQKASELEVGGVRDTADYTAQDAKASPEKPKEAVFQDDARKARVEMFKKLSGVGEATAYALADAGYEVAQKAEISLGIARTVQIAADRYLQEANQNEGGK